VIKILLATGNEGKRRELETLLKDLPIEILSLASFEILPEPLEDGLTFAENARRKAEHYYRLTGIPTIADDSGLEVDVLDGEPGVRSARFAPTDAERIAKLLDQLKSRNLTGESAVSARFVCAICAMLPDRRIEVEGRVEGRITREPRGDRGFGYDPVFYYPPLKKTFAEMSSEEKNRVSHRGKALRKLKIELEKILH